MCVRVYINKKKKTMKNILKTGKNQCNSRENQKQYNFYSNLMNTNQINKLFEEAQNLFNI